MAAHPVRAAYIQRIFAAISGDGVAETRPAWERWMILAETCDHAEGAV
jgi:hypothetical protein